MEASGQRGDGAARDRGTPPDAGASGPPAADGARPGSEPDDGASREPRHPIGAVTQRTGLTAHTLRAWERRYGVVRPSRSDGGHRLYSDADVEHLRLLHRLTLRGRQIGQIAELAPDELEALLREDRRAEATAPGPEAPDAVEGREVGRLLGEAYRAVERLEAERLDALLRRAALTLSTTTFLENLLVPLMDRIGEAWAERTLRPAHEHLASAIVTRVAGWLMSHFEPSGETPCLVTSTPAGQRHELGALAAAVTAAAEGWRVRYLGPDLPADDIALAAREVDAAAVALSIVYPEDDAAVADELRRLRASLPAGLPLLVGGGAAAAYGDVLEEVGAVRLDGFRSLRAVLERLAREGAG